MKGSMSETRLARPQEMEDEARRLHAGARRRLSAAAADLAVPEPLRLGDWQRSIVRSLFAKLVRTIEDELRSRLAADETVQSNEALLAAFTSAHLAITQPILERSSASADTDLLAAMMRRAEEHRHRRARFAEGEMPLLLDLIRDQDAGIAGDAMSFLIGQNRRLDSFSEPDFARTELPADLQHRLVWRVAAALRIYMTGVHSCPPAAADIAIVTAAGDLLRSYDEGDTLEARALRLVGRLDSAGRLDDAFLATAAAQGSQPLLIAALALRTGLAQPAVWDVLCDPAARGPVLLLKAAGLGQADAAAILLALSDAEEVVARQVDLLEVTGQAAAADALRLWRFDPGYRAAMAELDS
jgi:hypothetical protein